LHADPGGDRNTGNADGVTNYLRDARDAGGHADAQLPLG
jgi:hypothetical protein